MLQGNRSADGARRSWRLTAAAAIATALASTPALAGTVIYVDAAAAGGDGSSWENAYRHLHLALGAAAAGSELRVAQGTYVPDPEEGDRVATFQLIDDTALLGGYAGLGAADPDERDVEQYETILSGDLEGNDGPDFENYDDNSWHVVTASGTSPSAVIDGFTIRAGNANGPVFPEPDSIGAGMVNVTGSPTVTRCRFVANQAREAGAALGSMFSSTPDVSDCLFLDNRVPSASTSVAAGVLGVASTGGTYTRCVFRGNVADIGGAAAFQEDESIMVDCTFESNRAGQIGGAIATIDAAVQLLNCVFRDNLAFQGGAVYTLSSAPEVPNPTIFGCGFFDNEAFDGGAMINDGSSTGTVNCTFAGNEADEKAGGTGGAVLDALGMPLFKNCVFWGNTPNQIVDVAGADTRLKFCDIEGGWSGGGSSNVDVDPLFVDAAGGDYRLSAGSPVIDAGDNSGTIGFPETDLDGNPRYDDDPCTINTGRPSGGLFMIDLGAYEFQVTCPADLDCGGTVDFADIIELLTAWGNCGGCVEDLDGNGAVDFADVLVVLTAWGPCA